MIDIVYIGTSEYASAIRVSAESAIRRARNPQNVRIHIVTEDSDFPNIGYDVRVWKGDGKKRWHGTELVWSRIDFAQIFSDCDWVVSCDADTLWLAPPEELYDLRNDNLLMQGSVDCIIDIAHPVKCPWWNENNLSLDANKSYCCGLLLLNLKRMREREFSLKCKDFLEKYPNPPQCEQTVMCYVAKDESEALPREWGIFSFWHTSLDTPKLIHYAVDLPWQRDKVNRLMSDVVLLWWLECERIFRNQSPWQGYRGCKNKIDYAWRRGLYVFLRPFAWIIDRVGWLRPHFRNAKGFSKDVWRELVK